jgi:hypothetical protein
MLIFIFFKASIYAFPYEALPINYNDNNTLLKKKFIAYSPGIYAPLGILTGRTSKAGHSIYLSGRFNFQVFRKAQYYFEDGAVNDRSNNWYFTGGKKYSRWELHFGGMFNCFTLKQTYRLKIFAGAGVERSRYLYAYSNTAKLGNATNWVEFKEIGGTRFSPEAGIWFSIGEELNMHIGLSTIHKKHERMFTFGVGFGLASK